MTRVTNGWVSVRVELVHGRRGEFWPRPGRIIAVSSGHTFDQLAAAVDTSFGRWDRQQLYRFDLPDGPVIGRPHPDDHDGTPIAIADPDTATLQRLGFGEQFIYQFDHTERWTYLCTVGSARIDPVLDVHSLPAPGPTALWGWGTIPDQYGREWDTDDGTAAIPPRPDDQQLPAQPGWLTTPLPGELDDTDPAAEPPPATVDRPSLTTTRITVPHVSRRVGHGFDSALSGQSVDEPRRAPLSRTV